MEEEKEQTNKRWARPKDKQNNFLAPGRGRIGGEFVCVRYLNDVCIGPAFVWLIVLCVFEEHFVHVSAGILEELVWVIENNEGNLTVTQHTELVGFLHQTKLPFSEGHLWRKRERKLNWDGEKKKIKDNWKRFYAILLLR